MYPVNCDLVYLLPTLKPKSLKKHLQNLHLCTKRHNVYLRQYEHTAATFSITSILQCL